MKTPILMPVLSDTMTTGRLSAWNKRPGDPVRTGDPIATMESDKAVMDIEAFSDGFLSGPLAVTEADIPVGATIGYLCDTKEECEGSQASLRPAAPVPPPSPSVSIPAQAPAQKSAPLAPSPPGSASPPKSAGATAPLASPYARGLAKDLGVDLGLLSPGTEGFIVASQVLDMALGRIDPDLSFAPPHTVRTPSAMERAVVRNLERSSSVPVFHLSNRVALHPLAELAKSFGYSLTLALVKACALAILEHPRLNSLWTRQGILVRERVDIGVAIDTGEGLVAPVLRDVAGRPLPEISEDWRILKEKASLGRLLPADYLGGTFYLSNLGTYSGVVSFDAVLPPAASAILAVSAPAEGDQKSVFTLTCDHRILYGAHAARFSATLSRRLEEPSSWIAGPT